MEQPGTALDIIGEDQQPKDFEKNEEHNRLDSSEMDQEYVVDLLRYAFAVCLVAVSAKILLDVFLHPN